MSEIQNSEIQMSKIWMSEIQMSKIQMPEIRMSKILMSKIQMSTTILKRNVFSVCSRQCCCPCLFFILELCRSPHMYALFGLHICTSFKKCPFPLFLSDIKNMTQHWKYIHSLNCVHSIRFLVGSSYFTNQTVTS
jgi:hypothetical protein